MPAVDNQLRFRLPRQVHAALGQRDGRPRLEGHPECQGHPGRHAAEDPAVVVRFCFDNAVFQIKRVVVFAARQVGRVKAAAKVNALDRRDAEGRLGNTVFHPAEHWLAQPHRQSREDVYKRQGAYPAGRSRGQSAALPPVFPSAPASV